MRGIVIGIRLPKYPHDLSVEVEWALPIPVVEGEVAGGQIVISYKKFLDAALTLGSLVDVENGQGSVGPNPIIVEGSARSA